MAHKAYRVSWGDPLDNGCILVFAKSRGLAKGHAQACGPWMWPPFTELRTKREPDYDQYAKDTVFEHSIETNDDLPEGVTYFTAGGD